MTFAPGPDADDLRKVVRDLMAKRCAESDVRRLMDDPAGWDPALWAQLAGELGLHGLAVPEQLGGSGATPVELGVVFEELGAALYGGPFLASVGLAASALLELGGADAEALVPGIVDGSAVATLAWSGAQPAESTLTAADTGGWRVSGTAETVLDGATASLVLVAATIPSGPALFAVAADAPGLTRRPLTALDSTRRLAELRFDAVPARLLGTGAGPLQRAWQLGLLYLAAEQLGGAARMLEITVEYARTRIQFGRAIGSFSVIKHRCADLLVEVEAARSVVWHGLWSAANDPAALPAAAALARAVASDAYRSVTTASVQIQGGIGFTWEHPTHLYLKRAKSSQLLFGAPSRHRAELAALVGVTGPATVPLPAETPAEDRGPEVAALDAAITEFLAAHPVPDPTDTLADRAFREARFDAGLAKVAFPVGLGGRGLDPSLQPFAEGRFLAAGAADHSLRNVIGLGMAMATILAHGTEEQKQRYLRPCFSGEEIYCQLFSEPGAGSDLAALATRAVPDSKDGTDGYRVNGQKVWTSLAHTARRGILVTRTDPDVPKHAGLTYFVLDMQSPGVEVRPLRQLTGEDEFNEVYLTDVHVPDDCLLGGRRQRLEGRDDHAGQRAGGAGPQVRPPRRGFDRPGGGDLPGRGRGGPHRRRPPGTADAAVDPGRVGAPDQPAGFLRGWECPGAGGLDRQAADVRAQQGRLRTVRRAARPRRPADRHLRALRADRHRAGRGQGRAQVVAALAGQLDRGRHLGGAAHDPRRARARPARRAAGGQGHPVEGRAALVTVIEVIAAGDVVTIRLNRPEKRNAITTAMYAQLADELAKTEGAAVVVLTGAGGAFTAGNDVKDMLANPVRGEDSPPGRFLQALVGLRSVLVAAVDGPALGIGTTVLLHCDLVYATSRSIFGFPFVDLGLVPEAASTLLLPRLTGHQKAAEWMLLGERFPAAEAQRHGLVTAVAETPEELDALVAERTAALAAKPRAALLAARALLHDQTALTVPARLELDRDVFLGLLANSIAAPQRS